MQTFHRSLPNNALPSSCMLTKRALETTARRPGESKSHAICNSAVTYCGSGVWVIQALHGVHKPLPLAESDEGAAGEPATVLHPWLVRAFPRLQSPLAVETPHKVHMPCGRQWWKRSQQSLPNSVIPVFFSPTSTCPVTAL